MSNVDRPTSQVPKAWHRKRTSGWTGVQETETTFIWNEDDRETRVFDKRGDMKWYAAIQITCADTLREIVGAEDIF